MEPLIFQIQTQADDSGVRKFDKSVGGLNVSSQKASSAIKGFAADIAQARDGADIASAALGSFGRILGSSIGGTAVIVAGKTLIDAFNKIDNAVKESAKAVAEAFANMEKSGQALSFAEATTQAKTFEGVAENIRKKIKEINDSPLSTIIDGLTQSTDEMRKLADQSEQQAMQIRKSGAESELAHLQRIQGMDAEGKALENNSRALEKELQGIDAIKEAATALAVVEKFAMQADEIRAKFKDERDKTESEQAEKRQKEIDVQIKKEQELGEAQQKRFNELFEAEVKSQKAMQERMDATAKAEEERAAKGASLQQNLTQAKAQQSQQRGEGARDTARNISGGSASRGEGQRETSFEVGLRNSQARAAQQGRTEAADAQMQRTIDQIKQERAATGDSRFTGKTDAMNRMAAEAKASAREEGRASQGTDQMAQSVAEAEQAISDFAKSSQTGSTASESFSSNLSDLGTGFDEAMASATNLASSMTENSGNMVDDFLKTGTESSNLGDEFGKTSEAAKDLGEQLKKTSSPPPAGGAKKGEGSGSLASIEKLLQKNFDELKAYAHAT